MRTMQKEECPSGPFSSQYGSSPPFSFFFHGRTFLAPVLGKRIEKHRIYRHFPERKISSMRRESLCLPAFSAPATGHFSSRSLYRGKRDGEPPPFPWAICLFPCIFFMPYRANYANFVSIRLISSVPHGSFLPAGCTDHILLPSHSQEPSPLPGEMYRP